MAIQIKRTIKKIIDNIFPAFIDVVMLTAAPFSNEAHFWSHKDLEIQKTLL
jgi:hypothetical protein